MNRTDIEEKVARHYAADRATERILAALNLSEAPLGSVRVAQLFGVDQLHHGGVGLTEKMARFAQITSGLAVLDAGSGIGGSARFLADRFGCKVAAVDLSPDYVTTAADLDRLVGLSDKITHLVGSVTALPFDAESFDVVWSQNVTMNVPDKKTMFAEAFRVLRPGGVFVLSHIAKVDDAAITYPVPWAMSAETCFATSPAALLGALSAAGFHDVIDHAAGVRPAPPPPQSDAPDDSVAMGDDMPQRRANSGRAVAAGHLVPMLVTARR